MNFSNKFVIIQKGVKKALAKRPEWRSIEVVITSATRNRVARKGTWVRIPPSPPFGQRERERVKAFCFCLPAFLAHLFYLEA